MVFETNLIFLRVLITLIRYFGNFPCPRCLVPKSSIRLLGMSQDEEIRLQHHRVDSGQRRSTITKAWNSVYLKGKGVTSQVVDKLLSSESLVPVHVCISLDFNG